MSSITMSIYGLYAFDNTIFDGLKIPPELNRQTFIDNLLLECAEFEILYPDAQFMKLAITRWSETMLPIWQNLYETTNYEYDPISNYDRHEKWNDEASIKPGSTQTVSQQGYENSGFVESTKSTTGGKDTTESSREGRAWGNIGVTTTQQMITQEREKARFNIYYTMIDDFKTRFCLLIY